MEVHGRTHMPEDVKFFTQLKCVIQNNKLNKLSKLRREMTDLFHLFIYLFIY